MPQQNKVRVVVAVLMALVLSAAFAAGGRAGPAVAVTYKFIPGPQLTQNDEKVSLRIASADLYALPLTDVEWRNPNGAVVSCRPYGSGCATRNEYSGNGSLIATTHEFYIAGQHRTTGAYTAVAKYCYPDPYISGCTRGWAELFKANIYISNAPGAHRVLLPLTLTASDPFTITVR